MKIGIICAGDMEILPVLSILKNKTVTEKAMLQIHEGTVSGVPVAAVCSRVCKVNASIATQVLIDTCKVDCILNVGTAGGMDPRLNIFDVVISTEALYHDVEPEILTKSHPHLAAPVFPADEALLSCARIAAEKLGLANRVFFGRMVTGEAFITDEGREEINTHFAPLTVDMETAAIAHVCYVNKVPFLAIRCITDTTDHSGNDNFLKNCPKAAGIARDLAAAVINEFCGNA